MLFLVPVLVGLALAAQGDSSAVFESVYSPHELDLSPDPASADWASAPRVVIDRDYFGQPVGAPPTEVRSRWTAQNLYLLYTCRYEQLNLKPNPDTVNETPRLWNWDVAEAFIGSNFEQIGRYKIGRASCRERVEDREVDEVIRKRNRTERG